MAEIRLELDGAEARDVHSALAVVDELLAQVTPGDGAVLSAASRPRLQLVARRLDHELRHAAPNPWPAEDVVYAAAQALLRRRGHIDGGLPVPQGAAVAAEGDARAVLEAARGGEAADG